MIYVQKKKRQHDLEEVGCGRLLVIFALNLNQLVIHSSNVL